jgi:hypothetical protein
VLRLPPLLIEPLPLPLLHQPEIKAIHRAATCMPRSASGHLCRGFSCSGSLLGQPCRLCLCRGLCRRRCRGLCRRRCLFLGFRWTKRVKGGVVRGQRRGLCFPSRLFFRLQPRCLQTKMGSDGMNGRHTDFRGNASDLFGSPRICSCFFPSSGCCQCRLFGFTASSILSREPDTKIP